MANCILGIKCNGVSIKIDTLKIESDQTEYNYICNVSLVSENNGNGRYDISIVNKNLVQGFPIGKWRIVNAYISYNWGDSFAYFTMTDETGKETEEIMASRQKGCVSGFSEDLLARSIFTKAQKIVSEYPSVAIYSAILALDEEKEQYYWETIRNNFHKDNANTDDYIKNVHFAIDKMSFYLAKYQEVKCLLEKCEDERAKQLILRIANDCKTLLHSLQF